MKKLWITFIAVVGLSFAALIWVGGKIYQEQPPIPSEVLITGTNEIVYTK